MLFDSPIRIVGAFFVVISLILLCGYIGRYFLFSLRMIKRKKTLYVEESCMLDARRRLILVRHKNKGYLLLLGPHADLILESEIDNDTKKRDDLLETLQEEIK